MGKKSQRKGTRIERELARLHRDAQIHAERVPLSGAAGGLFAGDLRVAGTLRAEVKARASGEGFKTLERWLGGNDLLFLRRDRAKPLVVMEWDTYVRMMLHNPAALYLPEPLPIDLSELPDLDGLDSLDIKIEENRKKSDSGRKYYLP